MKVNKHICVITTVILAMVTSVSSAQSGSRGSTVVPQAVAQDAANYVVGNTEGVMVVGETIVPAQPAYETYPETTGSGYHVMPAPMIQACDCNDNGCTGCRSKRKRVSCRCKRLGCQGECVVATPKQPMFQSCEGDFCKLSVKHGKEKATCFKTEQVPVCIPAVRFPWQECCPPSKSRTRLVNKLKTEKYEVDSCSYKWSVEETNNCGAEPAAEPAPAKDKSKQPAKAEKVDAKPDVKSDVEATIEENVVPPAPAVKGAFLRTFRKR